jgi:hypothetical protein
MLSQVTSADISKFIEIGVIFSLFIWLITMAFPKLLKEHKDVVEKLREDDRAEQRSIRKEYADAFQYLNTERRETAREGHVAAERLSTAIENQAKNISIQAKVIHESTVAIKDLTKEIKTHKLIEVQ